MTRNIAVISGKGGVGKTTVALNLASAFANAHKMKTTIVDCNLTTSHLGLYLGTYHFPVTLNHVLRGENPINEAVYTIENGMDLVPASVSLKDLDGIDVFFLKEKIKELEGTRDIVLLDSAPGLGREALGALKASDEYIFVAQPNILSVTDIIRCHEVCNDLGIKPLGTVLNMVHKDRYEISRQDIEKLTGIPVLASIPYHKELRKAMAMKSPLVSISPNHDISRQMVHVSAMIAGLPVYQQQPGFFSRLRFW